LLIVALGMSNKGVLLFGHRTASGLGFTLRWKFGIYFGYYFVFGIYI